MGKRAADSIFKGGNKISPPVEEEDDDIFFSQYFFRIRHLRFFPSLGSSSYISYVPYVYAVRIVYIGGTMGTLQESIHGRPHLAKFIVKREASCLSCCLLPNFFSTDFFPRMASYFCTATVFRPLADAVEIAWARQNKIKTNHPRRPVFPQTCFRRHPADIMSPWFSPHYIFFSRENYTSNKKEPSNRSRLFWRKCNLLGSLQKFFAAYFHIVCRSCDLGEKLFSLKEAKGGSCSNVFCCFCLPHSVEYLEKR